MTTTRGTSLMKKLTAFAVGVVLAAAYAVAQNAPRQTVSLAGGVITVDAGRTELMGNGTAFSNGVVINVNGVRVTADRALVEVNDADGPLPEDIKLEGNVRLSLLKQAKP
jgi:hypothetical protein